MPHTSSQTFLRELDKKLWTSADKLHFNLDAAVYKHAVLGLIFLKYVSDSREATPQIVPTGRQTRPSTSRNGGTASWRATPAGSRSAAETAPHAIFYKKRGKYGTPPQGNANFAWVQHILHHLAPNGSMSSNSSGEMKTWLPS